MKKFWACSFVMLSVFGTAASASANDGDLDLTWGGTGTVYSSWSSTWGEVVRPYGTNQVMLAGLSISGSSGWDSSFIARYNEDGTLDPTCDSVGYRVYQSPDNFVVADMAVLADGSIVIAGTDTASGFVGKLIKFDANCQLVDAFADHGIFTYSEHDGVMLKSIDVDGSSLVLGGSTFFSPADGGDPRFTVYRIDATTGAFVNSFGGSNNGRFISDVTHEGNLRDLDVASDGTIAITGSFFGSTEEFVVAKLSASGTLVTQFANGGWFVRTGVNDESGRAIDHRSDGRIVILKSVIDATTSDTTAGIECLLSGGEIDTSCGINGNRDFVSMGITSSQFFDLIVDPSGRILTSGSINDSNTSFHPVVLRLNANGTRDETFDSDALVGAGMNYAHAFSVAIDQVGRILTSGIEYGAQELGWVARFDSTNLVPPTTSTIAPSLLPATGRTVDATTPIVIVLFGLALFVVRRVRAQSAQ
jgi:uncharacterized delta-60 repeat protein